MLVGAHPHAVAPVVEPPVVVEPLAILGGSAQVPRARPRGAAGALPQGGVGAGVHEGRPAAVALKARARARHPQRVLAQAQPASGGVEAGTGEQPDMQGGPKERLHGLGGLPLAHEAAQLAHHRRREHVVAAGHHALARAPVQAHEARHCVAVAGVVAVHLAGVALPVALHGHEAVVHVGRGQGAALAKRVEQGGQGAAHLLLGRRDAQLVAQQQARLAHGQAERLGVHLQAGGRAAHERAPHPAAHAQVEQHLVAHAVGHALHEKLAGGAPAELAALEHVLVGAPPGGVGRDEAPHEALPAQAAQPVVGKAPAKGAQVLPLAAFRQIGAHGAAQGEAPRAPREEGGAVRGVLHVVGEGEGVVVVVEVRAEELREGHLAGCGGALAHQGEAAVGPPAARARVAGRAALTVALGHQGGHLHGQGRRAALRAGVRPGLPPLAHLDAAALRA